jgi:hypothetical protein
MPVVWPICIACLRLSDRRRVEVIQEAETLLAMPEQKVLRVATGHVRDVSSVDQAGSYMPKTNWPVYAEK